MRSFSHDGAPIHASLERSALDRFPAFSVFGLLEGVVLKARYKDDPDNRSGKWTEYDVMEVSTRQIYPRARLGRLIGGLGNFEDVDLAETTGTTDGSTLIVENANSVRSGGVDVVAGTAPTESYKLNGERVAFLCFGGVYSNTMIIAVLPHPEGDFSSRRSEAPRRKLQFNSWTQTIDKAENLVLVHEDGRELSLRSDGSIMLRTKEGARFQINSDGSIEIVQSGGLLRLGSSAASFSALKGELTIDTLMTLAFSIAGLAAAVGGWVTAAVPVVGNQAANGILTAAMTTLAGTMTALAPTFETTLPSNTVKVP